MTVVWSSGRRFCGSFWRPGWKEKAVEALRQIKYCKLVYDLVDREQEISSAGMDLPIMKSASRELEGIALVTRLLQKAKYAYREGEVYKLQTGAK